MHKIIALPPNRPQSSGTFENGSTLLTRIYTYTYTNSSPSEKPLHSTIGPLQNTIFCAPLVWGSGRLRMSEYVNICVEMYI